LRQALINDVSRIELSVAVAITGPFYPGFPFMYIARLLLARIAMSLGGIWAP
jgi:hypothetical protein